MELEKEMKVYYLLNEEGQKKSILAGGDGKEQQCITCKITPELLKLANVSLEGEVVVGFGGELNSNKTLSQIVVDRQIHNIKGDGYGSKPSISNSWGCVKFAAPKTVEELLIWQNEFSKKMAQKETNLQAKLTESLQKYKENEAKINAEKAERDEKEKAEREKVAAEREKVAAEKANWIEKFGSSRLKDAFNLDYNCQRLYAIERATKEFPDFFLDFDDECDWQSRVCPSEQALSEIKKLIKNGNNAEVVWLNKTSNSFRKHFEKQGKTCFPDDSYEDDDYEEKEEEEEEEEDNATYEAIVIKDYLGSYYLIKM